MARYSSVTRTRGNAPSHGPPDTKYVPALRAARRLGWFSIGLGAVQIVLPELVSEATGVRDQRLLALCGLRELTCGVGLLMADRPVGWLWGRVAGDVIDGAILGSVIAKGAAPERRAALLSAAAVTGVAAVDVACATIMTLGMELDGGSNPAETMRNATALEHGPRAGTPSFRRQEESS